MIVKEKKRSLKNIEVHLHFSADAPLKKLRLLYLVGQLRSGGLERQLFYLLQGMDRECYKPAVVVWNFCRDERFADEILSLGVPIYSFSKGTSRGAKLRALSAILKLLNPEVIHSYSFFTNFAAQWAACGTKSIPIGSLRSDFSWARKECGLLLGCISARWPAVQIYNSYSAAQKAQESNKFFRPKKIFVVQNRLNVNSFSGFSTSIPDEGLILGIGSLYSVKRWDRLLVAAAEIKRKGIKFHLQIAGDGPLRNVLQKQMVELGISDCVKFLGNRPDISSLINNARFLVHTSDSEGCPNIVMEAMACGRPVVAMDAGDIPFLIDEGRTGFVIQKEDQASLVQRILDLLNNHSLCVQMGKAAREKAEREFEINHLIRETLEVYCKSGWKNFNCTKEVPL